MFITLEVDFQLRSFFFIVNLTFRGSNVAPQHTVVKYDANLTYQKMVAVEINKLDPFDFTQADTGLRDKKFYVFDDQSIVLVHSPYGNDSHVKELRIVRYDGSGTVLWNTTYDGTGTKMGVNQIVPVTPNFFTFWGSSLQNANSDYYYPFVFSFLEEMLVVSTMEPTGIEKVLV